MLKKMLKSVLPIALVIAMLFSQSALAATVGLYELAENGIEPTGTKIETVTKDQSFAVVVSNAGANAKVGILIYEDANANNSYDDNEVIIAIEQVTADASGNATKIVTLADYTADNAVKAIAIGSSANTGEGYAANDTFTVGTIVTTHTVTFVDYDGTPIKTEEVAAGSAATAPEDPTREGYTFTGWDVAFNEVTSDLTVTAQYAKNSYKVTFTINGEYHSDVMVEHGAFATAPEYTAEEGYTFGGWDVSEAITAEKTIDATLTKNESTTWTATFNVDGIDKVVREKELTAEERTFKLPEATKADYAFAGWAAGEEFLPAGYNYELKDDVDFKAVWIHISMLNGAAIRLDKTNPGIRFTSYVDNAGFAKIKELDPDATCGTILINNDVRKDAGAEFNVNALDENSVFYKGVPAKKFAYNEPKVVNSTGIAAPVDEFRVVMVIKETDEEKYRAYNWGARSYVKYTYSNGDKNIIYANFDEKENVRSAKEEAEYWLGKNIYNGNPDALYVLNMYAGNAQSGSAAE